MIKIHYLPLHHEDLFKLNYLVITRINFKDQLPNTTFNPKPMFVISFQITNNQVQVWETLKFSILCKILYSIKYYSLWLALARAKRCGARIASRLLFKYSDTEK